MRQAARLRPRSRVFWNFALAFGLLALSAPMIHHESAVIAGDEAVVRGVVRDAGGAPIVGAQVLMVDPTIARRCPDLLVGSTMNLWLAAGPDKPAGSEATKSRTARSNAEGQFEFSREADSAPGILLILAEGFAPHLEALGGGQAQKVTLERGSDVELRLVTEFEKPVEDAEVTLVPLAVCGPVVEAFSDLVVSHARGDSVGKVVFRNVPGGTYALRLFGKGRLTSDFAPLVVRAGANRFRLRVPWGRTLRGRVEYPSHTAHSPGSVMALWKDPEGELQWAEAPLSGAEGDFVLNGLPFDPPVRLLARTESGLSSRMVSLNELPQADDALKDPIPLKLPADWHGKLPDGVAASSLVVEFLLPSFSPPEMAPDAITVPIGTDRQFVIPNVPSAAEGMRLIVPGYGESQVRLEDGSSWDLGRIQFQQKPIHQGRIEWEDHSPPLGAEVEVLSAASSLCRARVNSAGEFACAASPAVLRDLRYRAWIGGTVFQLTPRPGGSVPSFVVAPGVSVEALVSRPGDHGRVEDLGVEIGNGPVAGDNLSSRRQSERNARSPDGHLSLHVVGVGKVQLTLSNPEGGAVTSASVDLAADAAARKIKVTLPEGPAVFGTVKAAPSGKPIEAAEVEVCAAHEMDDRVNVSRVSRTNGDGAWRQAGVRDGNYMILASAPSYAVAQKRVSVPRESVASQEFLLQRPGRIHGKVLGLHEGDVATLTVTPGSAWKRWIDFRPELDSEAEFTLDNVSPERYRVSLLVKRKNLQRQLQAISSRFQTVTVEAGEAAEVEFDLRAGLIVTGRAYLGNEPAKNATVNFSRRSKKNRISAFEKSTTGDQGQYEMRLPGPGSYLVYLEQQLSHHGGVMVELDRRLVIGGGETQTRELHFSDGLIRGRVLDSQGNPVLAVVHYVGTIPEGDSEVENERYRHGDRMVGSGEDGTFQIRPLAAADYSLEIMASGSATRKIGPLFLAHDQTVDIQDVVLDSELSLSIFAQGPGGGPLNQTHLYPFSVSDLKMRFSISTNSETDESGLAKIERLSPGTYSVVGIHPGLAPAYLEDIKVPLEEPTTPLTLQFAPGGSLDLRVVRKTGEPVPDIVPQILDTQGRDLTMLYEILAAVSGTVLMTDTGGHVVLDTVRPGEYSIKAWQGSKSEARSVTVKAGQTTSVVLVAEDEEGD